MAFMKLGHKYLQLTAAYCILKLHRGILNVSYSDFNLYYLNSINIRVITKMKCMNQFMYLCASTQSTFSVI